MIDTPEVSEFVSQVVEVGFADAADQIDRLSGQTLAAGPARLEIGARLGHGLAGAIWYEGVLDTGSRWARKITVDVMVTPWSAGRTEIGLRPLGRLGDAEGARARRYYTAAVPVVEQLAAGLTPAPVETPVPDQVAVGA